MENYVFETQFDTCSYLSQTERNNKLDIAGKNVKILLDVLSRSLGSMNKRNYKMRIQVRNYQDYPDHDLYVHVTVDKLCRKGVEIKLIPPTDKCTYTMVCTNPKMMYHFNDEDENKEECLEDDNNDNAKLDAKYDEILYEKYEAKKNIKNIAVILLTDISLSILKLGIMYTKFVGYDDTMYEKVIGESRYNFSTNEFVIEIKKQEK